MANDNEVRISLVVDDKSSETLNKVKHGLEEVAKGHEHASHEAAEHAKHAAEAHGGGEHGEGFFGTLKHHLMAGIGMGVGAKLAEGIAEGIHEIPHMLVESFDEGVKAIEAQRSIAGTLTLSGAKGSYDQVLDDAKLYKESLQDIAIESGNTEDTLRGVFEGIAARSNKSSVEVEELTEKIAYAGKAIRGGPEAISQGFEMLTMGVVRARNPIVQMITQAHLLEGNAKAVAKQMMKMTPEEQIKLGEKAITSMADKMKDVTPTFTQLKQSFEGMKEFAFESLGEPLVEEVVPHLNDLKKYLLLHKNEIAAYAHQVAESMIEYGKEAVSYLTELKDIASGSKMPSPEELDLTKPGDVVKGATAFFKEGLDGLSMAMRDTKTAMLAQWGPTSTIGGAIFEGKRQVDVNAATENAKYAYDPQFAKATQENLDAWKRWNDYLVANGGHISAEQQKAFDDVQAQFIAAEQMGQNLADQASKGNVENLAMAYNEAAKKHNMGLQQYITHLIGGSEELEKKLVESGMNIEGGYSEFIRIMKASGFGEQADKLAKMKKESGAKESAPVTNFNGGQTFQIKQDFRDQDPDRIAVLFRQDILKAAKSRVQSNRATVFGF